jgi:membrane-bound serine protease (ClpP class)
MADGLDSLLAQSEGREVTLSGGVTATIAVEDAPIVENGQNLYERVLRVVSDPVVVSLLLLVGIGLIFLEVSAPGLFVPGSVGVLALLLALVGIGTLLPEEAAVALIVLGVVLFVLEVFLPGGLVGSIGALALIIGLGTLLGRGSTEIDFSLLLRIGLIVVVAVGLLVGAAFVLIARRYMAGTEPPGTARL